MIGISMSTTENKWDAYLETPLEESDPALDDPIIYKSDGDHFTLTVYSPEGQVNKYWNARILKDELGYVRVACPRDKKILHFNAFKWSAYFFVQSGLKNLVMMPDSSRRTITKLTKEVK